MGLLYVVVFFWTLLIGGGGLLASCMGGSHQSATFLPTILVGFGPLALIKLLGARAVRCANQPPESSSSGPSRSSR